MLTPAPRGDPADQDDQQNVVETFLFPFGTKGGIEPPRNYLGCDMRKLHAFLQIYIILSLSGSLDHGIGSGCGDTTTMK
jgi:hypothetical protein